MKLEVEGHPLWVFNEEITLSIHDNYHNRDISFKLPIEDRPPFEPFIAKLSDDQIAGLWYIAESIFFLKQDGCPGWLLAKKLEMPHSHISSRVTTPLKKSGLINFKTRPTTNPESSHPRKTENAWFIERLSMKKAFMVLYSIFEIRDFNNLIGPEQKSKIENNHKENINQNMSKTPKQGDPVKVKFQLVGPLKFHSPLVEEYEKKIAGQEKKNEKIDANMKLLILAYLQEKIEEYEYSEQYFIDTGVKPPLGVSSKADYERVEVELEKAFKK